ncbi:MAG: UvrD-helicase domain-containing protein [Patescibacteria group bacterium]
MNNSYLQDLNERQLKAVLKTEGPLLIIAGAGAGKTKTITTRILHLCLNGVSPDSILAITFTNKAAKEMRERVTAAIDKHAEGGPVFANMKPFVSTFHSLGVYLLRQFGNRVGLNKTFSILDRDDSKKKVKDILVAKGHDPKKIEPSKVLNIISKQKGNSISLAEYTSKTLSGEEGYVGETVAAVWEAYDKELMKEKAVDFDDLLSLPVRILKENPDIRQMINNKWQYIHVDEYQDTNPIQYELCRLLAGTAHNIAVVGDADQTIYSWRGANIKHILEFEHDFPGTEAILLEQNYRSTGIIIETANAVIDKNIFRTKKLLFTDKERGEKLTVYVGLDEIDESRYVAQEIQNLMRNGVQPSQIAVLYRANFQSRTLEGTCLAYNIPYQVLGTKFFERKEIKDMIGYLRAAINRDSITDIKRTINTPARGIGKVTLLKVVEDKVHEIPQAARIKVQEYFRLLDTIKQKSETEKLSDVIKYIFQASGLEKIFISGNEDDAERAENVKELVSLTTKYDVLPPAEAIELFLEEASLMSDQDQLNEKGMENKVRLMTVHASKGLEYDYVFVTGMEEGLFPYERTGETEIKQASESEEERRLFYVAITRACKKVYLCYVMMRTIFGAKQFRTKSGFIDDIPKDLIDSVDNTFAMFETKKVDANGRRTGGLLDLSDIDF